MNDPADRLTQRWTAPLVTVSPARRIALAPPGGQNDQGVVALDWRKALHELVLAHACPWCMHPITAPGVSERGLTWTCLGGCNP